MIASDFESLAAEVDSASIRLSRTRKTGRVDLASSDAKPLPDRGCGHLPHDLLDMLTFLACVDTRHFGVPDLVKINAKVVSNHYSSSHFRTFPVEKFGYLDPPLIKQDVEHFIQWVNELSPSADPARSVATAHYHINLKGHYFEDGCGRTAVVIGAWLSACISGLVLSMPMRPDYLAAGTLGIEALTGAIQACNVSIGDGS